MYKEVVLIINDLSSSVFSAITKIMNKPTRSGMSDPGEWSKNIAGIPMSTRISPRNLK
jgi:hypothetical protein